MKLTADQIIQLIVDQTNLPKAEVFDRIHQLQRSFNYPLDDLEHDEDSTFPKLLAQELNVDLGVPPYDYLYPELLFDEAPLIVRIIPFTTVDKAKIKTTLRNMILELEDGIKYHYLAVSEVPPNGSTESRQILDNLSIGLNEELHFLTFESTFVRDGIWMLFHSYSTDIHTELYFEEVKDFKPRTAPGNSTLEDFNVGTLKNSSLEDIIDRSELYRTFTDNRIIRTSDPDITYLPYSLVHMVMVRPPDWGADVNENRNGNVQFPYISLESLRTTPNLETFGMTNPWVKEIIGTEALQYCRNLKMISIQDEIGTLQYLQFPPDLSLPNLEHFEIAETDLSLDEFDLSFLNNSPKLRYLHLYLSSTIRKLILPPFDNHLLLEQIEISATIGSIIFSSPWHCPNLRRVDISCNLEKIDLTPLQHCSALRELSLSSNQFKSLDLTPLEHCHDLRELNLSFNQFKSPDLSPLRHCADLQIFSLSNNLLTEIGLSPLEDCPALERLDINSNLLPRIDLSPLLSCPNLQILSISNNLLTEIDLTPLANHPSLEALNIESNHLQHIDLSPLHSCPNLNTINLKDNPIENIPKDLLDQQDSAVLLRYDSL